MYVVRLGSYSIVATFAGTPSLRRRKSILRYRRLAPPLRWRDVMRPCVFRPPDLGLPLVSGLCGLPWVSSSRSWKVANRRPGEVGFDFRIAMSLSLLRHRGALEQLDPFAGRQLDDRLLPGSRAAGVHPAALGLRAHLRGTHGRHPHLEDLLDGARDLRLVSAIVDPEGVLAVRHQGVALLGDDRLEDDLANVHQRLASFARFSSCSSADSEITSD